MAGSFLDVGAVGSCAVLAGGHVRCWGRGTSGQLGYGSPDDIGDNETPGTVGPVDLGTRRTAVALSSGYNHSCAILDNGRVRCWGRNNNGELGYGNTDDIGDNETPDSAGPVKLGAGRTAVAISDGADHSCAILDNGRVRCWGSNSSGQLGYPSKDAIGDDETPDAVGPVDLGAGRTAVAISGGGSHTCALLDNQRVRCWGAAFDGQLGYGNQHDIGDDETPGSVGPVDLGTKRTPVAITGGNDHTCVILDNGRVRCWGSNGSGQLGYPGKGNVGDDETPASVGSVNLGAGRTAVAISAGDDHTCALLDNGRVRCWGSNSDGQLGYPGSGNVGDDESPGSVGPVDLGAGSRAVAIAAGALHTCALLDTGRVRCWGDGNDGQLGYGNEDAIGDNETPGSVGPVSLAGKVPTRAASELSLKAKPRRDRAKPFKFRLSGELDGFIPDLATCAGEVTVRAARGAKAAGSASASLRLDRGRCLYRARLKATRRGRLRLTARFPGDTNLRSDRSGVVKIRAG